MEAPELVKRSPLTVRVYVPLSAVLVVDIVVLSTVLRVAQDGSEAELDSVWEIVTELPYQVFVL